MVGLVTVRVVVGLATATAKLRSTTAVLVLHKLRNLIVIVIAPENRACTRYGTVLATAVVSV